MGKIEHSAMINRGSGADDERGETDLMEFSIETGSASPKRQAARRIPFAARQEITSQLDKMQRNNVVKPSESPWAEQRVS